MYRSDNVQQASTLVFPDRSTLTWMVVLAAAIFLTLFPLLLVDIPLLLDHPNHLARSYVISHLANDPDLARYYEVDWKLVPNLASDIVMAVLTTVTSLETAGNILIGIIVLTTLAGVLLLHKVLFGRLGWWPLVAFFFLYHGAVTAGFTSFSLGIGLMLLAIAQWIVLRDAPVAVRLAGGVASTMILFVAHLLALGFFGILVGGYELTRILQRPRGQRFGRNTWTDLLVLGLPFVPPLALFLRVQMADTPVPGGTKLLGNWTLSAHLRGILMPVLNYNLMLDIVTLVALGGIVLALLHFRKVKVATPLLPGIAVLLLMFLVLPGSMLDTGYTVERFPIVLALVGMASIRPDFPKTWVTVAIASVLSVLFVTRMVVLMLVWHQHDRYMAEFRSAVQPVERGSRLLIADTLNDSTDLFRRVGLTGPSGQLTLVTVPALTHMPSMAVVERSVFYYS